MSFYSLSVYPSISIHALREERDALLADLGEQGFGISIHALREERDYMAIKWLVDTAEFQSTRSARSATQSMR